MSETGRDYQDSIELAAYNKGEKLDGFDIHKQANYSEVSATFILESPEPRRGAFAVVNPENFRVGDDITIDVVRDPKKFKDEQARLKLLQIEMNRLSDEIELIKSSNNGSLNAQALRLLEQYNFCRSKMVNPAAGHEFGEVAGFETYKGIKNVIVLRHNLQFYPFGGGTCVKIEYWSKKHANARIADLPESKWGLYLGEENLVGEVIGERGEAY